MVGYLWDWFCSLTGWRESSMGVGPLLHSEMECWTRLMGVSICPHEVDALRRLDLEFRSYCDERDKPEKRGVGAALSEVAGAHGRDSTEIRPEVAKKLFKRKVKK